MLPRECDWLHERGDERDPGQMPRRPQAGWVCTVWGPPRGAVLRTGDLCVDRPERLKVVPTPPPPLLAWNKGQQGNYQKPSFSRVILMFREKKRVLGRLRVTWPKNRYCFACGIPYLTIIRSISVKYN